MISLSNNKTLFIFIKLHILFFALGNIFWDLTLTQDLLDSALPLAPNNRFLWHVTICLARRRIALAARLPVVFRYINMIGTPTKRYATVNSRDIGERFQSIPLPEMQMDLYLYSLLKFQQLHDYRITNLQFEKNIQQ